MRGGGGAWGSIRGDPEGDGSEYFHSLIIGFASIHHLLLSYDRPCLLHHTNDCCSCFPYRFTLLNSDTLPALNVSRISYPSS